MDAPALFFLIISTHQVADGAGTTFGVTDNQLSACVDFFAAKPMDTKVMRVVEAAFIPSVSNPIFKDFIGYGGWVLTKVLGNLTKRLVFI